MNSFSDTHFMQKGFGSIVLAGKILDLLYTNGVTYEDCTSILEIVQDEINESRKNLEYQTASNYLDRKRVCDASRMPMHHRFNMDYLQSIQAIFTNDM